jgi:hypothetical protein
MPGSCVQRCCTQPPLTHTHTTVKSSSSKILAPTPPPPLPFAPRYFVLTGTVLRYYRSERDAALIPRGVVDVQVSTRALAGQSKHSLAQDVAAHACMCVSSCTAGGCQDSSCTAGVWLNSNCTAGLWMDSSCTAGLWMDSSCTAGQALLQALQLSKELCSCTAAQPTDKSCAAVPCVSFDALV